MDKFTNGNIKTNGNIILSNLMPNVQSQVKFVVFGKISKKKS
jgi:hypothetical protein